MLRSESWIAAMPSIFFCLRTWRRTYANTGIGNRACMILVNARSSTGCGCTCLTCTRMALAIRRFPRSSDEEEGDLPPPLASVQLLLHVGPRLRLQSLSCLRGCPSHWFADVFQSSATKNDGESS